MSYTFDVADVEKGDLKYEVAEFKRAAEIHLRHIRQYHHHTAKLPGYIQKFNCTASLIHPHKKHNFFSTVFAAYNNHLPLSISPDHIWTLIAQGLAQHIHQDPARYRNQLVSHEGKKELKLIDNTAVLESEENNWEGFVDSITEQITEHIGVEKYHRLVPHFSTTTPIEALIHKIGLMDTVSDFFKYTFVTMCGIPQITLEGTSDDWLKLIEQTEILHDFDLSDWQMVLVKTIQQFHKASQGDVDLKFWNNIINERNESGGPYISGWVLNFLNYYSKYVGYDEDGAQYKLSKMTNDERGKPMTWENIPSNMSRVPVTWEYHGTKIELDLYAGFFGMSQTDDFTLRPELGWILKRSPR